MEAHAPRVPFFDVSAWRPRETPPPWSQTTGGCRSMTPTPTNGRPTLRLTLRWTGQGPSRPALPIILFRFVHRFASFFSGPGSCRASCPQRGCFFLPRVGSWLGLPSFRWLTCGPCARRRRAHRHVRLSRLNRTCPARKGARPTHSGPQSKSQNVRTES